MESKVSVPSKSVDWKTKVQKFGGMLSSMIMPNIGAFIAWGLITALFIPTGWFPNETLGQLVDPSIKYLLPLLIAYTAGANVYDRRGGVIGAVATMGIIIGSDMPMLMGAMVMGPVAAIIIRRVDKLYEGKVKPGLEMLVDNFSIGIVGGILMILGLIAIEPIFNVILSGLSTGVNWFVDKNLIPLTSIFVAPAQVLFLNNAINHGIMSPLGIEQVVETGKSILFLVEGNSGPLVGVMLAFCFFGKGVAKKTAPASTIIVMFGGIAEVYFPYILMKPILVLAPIFGSMTSLTIFQFFGGGTVAVPSPGSIIAFLLMTPRGSFIVNIVGYFAGMGVSCLIASFLLKRDKTMVDDTEELIETEVGPINDGAALEHAVAGAQTGQAITGEIDPSRIHKIVVACDAGMGSSAMGASMLKTKVNKAMLNMEVINKSINNIPDDADLVITHQDLLDRAIENNKDKPNIQYLTLSAFMDGAEYDAIVKKLKDE
ncbi:PTS mannitol transporter subunit IICB [Candidatus Enterococcus ferrettii]|uniref:PTS system mannitol-specific EIICB component n=1 Tax=Candidatus Enterococcus ferrettii TaxID=2815324 RepID=A0ABV0EWJ8_9ENTE|nr:PTS transporter subunit EIIC [Enterococcus sp. 665A]MBO1342339.1 PTS transporter subunit EIIC [Enterococcus sp. 665A]